MDDGDDPAASTVAAKVICANFVKFIMSSLSVLRSTIYHGYSDSESALTALSQFQACSAAARLREVKEY
jgi:hypothetical protein